MVMGATATVGKANRIGVGARVAGVVGKGNVGSRVAGMDRTPPPADLLKGSDLVCVGSGKGVGETATCPVTQA